MGFHWLGLAMHIGDRYESLGVVARDLNYRLRASVLSHFRSGPDPTIMAMSTR